MSMIWASQNWYSCFHLTLNRSINLCFESGSVEKQGPDDEVWPEICLGQEINSAFGQEMETGFLQFLKRKGWPNTVLGWDIIIPFHSHKDWDHACHPGFFWLLLAYQKSQIVTIHSFLDLQKMIPKTFYRFSESAFGELLDQFGEMILLILIQIYKSGVTNWLSFQNTSFTGPGVMPSYKPTRCGQHVASSDGSKMISHKINTCEIFKTLCRTLIYYEITRVQNSEL